MSCQTISTNFLIDIQNVTESVTFEMIYHPLAVSDKDRLAASDKSD